MTTWKQLPLIFLLLLAAASARADDPRQAWLQATVADSAPLREQLAMLSQPGQPLRIRVYHGHSLRAAGQPPLVARLQGQELALSEGLLDHLLQLQQQHGGDAGRWTLLYVLGYLAARHPQLQSVDSTAPQQQALAMLTAVNLVLASAWHDAGRPSQAAQRERLLRQVIAAVSYAQPLQPALDGVYSQTLRRDAEGFVLDRSNAYLLASALRGRGSPGGLD